MSWIDDFFGVEKKQQDTDDWFYEAASQEGAHVAQLENLAREWYHDRLPRTTGADEVPMYGGLDLWAVPKVPEKDRESFLKVMEQTLANEPPLDRGLGRTLAEGAFGAGPQRVGLATAGAAAEFLGAGDENYQRFARRAYDIMYGARRRDVGSQGGIGGLAERGLTSAAEMAPAMVMGGNLMKGVEVVAGAKAAVSAGMAFWGAQEAPSIIDDLRAAGAKDTDAKAIALSAAPLIGAIEFMQWKKLIPSAVAKKLRETGAKTLLGYGKQALKTYGAELGEEALQGGVALAGKAVSEALDSDVKFDWRQELLNYKDEMVEAGLGLGVIMGPGQVIGGLQQRAEGKQRAERLQQIRTERAARNQPAQVEAAPVPPPDLPPAELEKWVAKEAVRKAELDAQRAQPGVSMPPVDDAGKLEEWLRAQEQGQTPPAQERDTVSQNEEDLALEALLRGIEEQQDGDTGTVGGGERPSEPGVGADPQRVELGGDVEQAAGDGGGQGADPLSQPPPGVEAGREAAAGRASDVTPFVPTAEWQDVPDDAVLPAGMQIKMDMTTGRKQARIHPDTVKTETAPVVEPPATPEAAQPTETPPVAQPSPAVEPPTEQPPARSREDILAEKAMAGDKAAENELFTVVSGWAAARARGAVKKAGNRSVEADDVSQDAAIRVLEELRAGKYDPSRPFKAWAFKYLGWGASSGLNGFIRQRKGEKPLGTIDQPTADMSPEQQAEVDESLDPATFDAMGDNAVRQAAAERGIDVSKVKSRADRLSGIAEYINKRRAEQNVPGDGQREAGVETTARPAGQVEADGTATGGMGLRPSPVPAVGAGAAEGGDVRAEDVQAAPPRPTAQQGPEPAVEQPAGLAGDAAVKKPWEMSREEYFAEFLHGRKALSPPPRGSVFETRHIIDANHRQAVKDAIDAGTIESHPDYPEFSLRSEQPPASEPSGQEPDIAAPQNVGTSAQVPTNPDTPTADPDTPPAGSTGSMPGGQAMPETPPGRGADPLSSLRDAWADIEKNEAAAWSKGDRVEAERLSAERVKLENKALADIIVAVKTSGADESAVKPIAGRVYRKVFGTKDPLSKLIGDELAAYDAETKALAEEANARKAKKTKYRVEQRSPFGWKPWYDGASVDPAEFDSLEEVVAKVRTLKNRKNLPDAPASMKHENFRVVSPDGKELTLGEAKKLLDKQKAAPPEEAEPEVATERPQYATGNEYAAALWDSWGIGKLRDDMKAAKGAKKGKLKKEFERLDAQRKAEVEKWYPGWTSTPPDPGRLIVKPLRGGPAVVIPERPAKGGPSRKIGVNADGQDVYEDDRGVRSYVDGGVKITEPVSNVPTRGGVQTSVPTLENKSPEFKTTEELANERPADQGTTGGVPAGDIQTQSTGEVQPSGIATPGVAEGGVGQAAEGDRAVGEVGQQDASPAAPGQGEKRDTVSQSEPTDEAAMADLFAKTMMEDDAPPAKKGGLRKKTTRAKKKLGGAAAKTDSKKKADNALATGRAAAEAEVQAGIAQFLAGVKKLSSTTASDAPLNADIVQGLAKAAKGLVKLGVYDFAALVKRIAEAAGVDVVRQYGRVMELGWDKVRESNANMQPSSPVADILKEMSDAQEVDTEAGVRGPAGVEDGAGSPAGSEAAADGGVAQEPRPAGEAAGSAGEGVRNSVREDSGAGDQGRRPDTGAGDVADAGPGGGSGTRGGTAYRRRGTASATLPRFGGDNAGSDHRVVGAVAPKSPVAKLRANLKAIRILKSLETDNRPATAEEQTALAAYTGWGSLSNAFDREAGETMLGEREPWWKKSRFGYYSDYKSPEQERAEKRQAEWEKMYGEAFKELRDTLSDEEWSQASASTLNAHYTSHAVVKPMWDIARRLGFVSGSALELGAGIGNFVGMAPDGVDAKFTAVEMDPTSAKILKALYPSADVVNDDLNNVKLAPNSVDLVIGNVPFHKQIQPDSAKRYGQDLNLHNYFFARAVDALRPGGVMIAITTHRTMDQRHEQRKWLSERAELVGAIRLPNNAFMENAGTEVTTDIVILRKPGGNVKAESHPWTSVVDVPVAMTDDNGPGVAAVNEYFAAHPEMVLGTHSMSGKMYSREKDAVEYTLQPKDEPLDGLLAKAGEQLPENVIGEHAKPTESVVQEKVSEVPEGTVFLKDGVPHVRMEGKVVPVGNGGTVPDGWSKKLMASTAHQRAIDYIGVRDKYRDLHRAMLDEQASDGEIKQLQDELSSMFDKYVAKHGHFDEQKSSVFERDPGYYFVASLETVAKRFDTATKKVVSTYGKAAVFTKRTIAPRVAPISVTSVQDAIVVSLGYRGKIDMEYIGQLMGRDIDAVYEESLQSGLLFENPKTGEVETKDVYLTGNVRQKLLDARVSAEEDERYKPNVEALEKAQPSAVGINDIGYRLGGTWLPADVVTQYAKEAFNDANMEVAYIREADRWVVTGDAYSVEAQETWGVKPTHGEKQTNGKNGVDLFGDILNLRPIRVTRPESYVKENGEIGTRYVTDEKGTLEAKRKAKMLQDRFHSFVNGNEARKEKLATAYNERYNAFVDRKYDGSHLVLPGKSDEIQLRPYQLDAIWRFLQERRVLLAHSVGSGKTYDMIAMAMEARRLGIANRPFFVVQNSTLGQFATSFMRLYPGAKVLVAAKEDLKAENRKAFMSRVVSGDWDAVVMAQSTFDRMPVSPEAEIRFINEQLLELEEVMRDAAHSSGKGAKQKGLENAKKELKKKLDKAKERLQKSGDIFTFEELGADMLLIDEAHAYKKPPYNTKLDKLVGLQKQFSARGMSTLMKVRHVQSKAGGKNIVFATGTPVTNTLGETWHMMNFVAPDVLREYDADTFDRFVSAFALQETIAQMNAGGKLEMKEALSKFQNLPELSKMIRAAWDVLTTETMTAYMQEQGKGLPRLKGGKVQSVIVDQPASVQSFTRFLNEAYTKFKSMEPKQRRELSYIPAIMYGAAKRAALDIRLLYPNAKPDETGKAQKCVEIALQEYRDSESVRGTQMIFSDAFNPFNMTHLNHFMAGESVQVEYDIAEKSEEESQEDARKVEAESLLFKDIKRRLIAGGVAAHEIAIVADFKTDAARTQLWDNVNSGNIRFLLGSTARMGVGVNAQERMVALHHLDAPWFPADLEQREGRILRWGNVNEEVSIYRYAMKKTLDSAIYDKIIRKAKFIWQVLSGKVDARTADDPASEATMDMEEMQALINEDPEFLEQIQLQNELRDLEMERESHVDAVTRAQDAVRELRESNGRLENEILPEGENRLKTAKELAASDVTFNGKPMSRADAVKEIDAVKRDTTQRVENKTRHGDAKPTEVAHRPRSKSELSDKIYRQNGVWIKVNGYDVHLMTGVYQTVWGKDSAEESMQVKDEDGKVTAKWVIDHDFDVYLPGDDVSLNSGTATTGSGLLSVMGDIPNVLQKANDSNRERVQKNTRSIAEYEKIAAQEWTKDEQMAKMRARISDISASRISKSVQEEKDAIAKRKAGKPKTASGVVVREGEPERKRIGRRRSEDVSQAWADAREAMYDVYRYAQRTSANPFLNPEFLRRIAVAFEKLAKAGVVSFEEALSEMRKSYGAWVDRYVQDLRTEWDKFTSQRQRQDTPGRTQGTEGDLGAVENVNAAEATPGANAGTPQERDTVSQNSDDNLTSISNAGVDEQRVRRGEPIPANRGKPERPWEDLNAKVDIILAVDRGYPERLVAELTARRRPTSDVENTALGRHYRERVTQYNRVMGDWQRAVVENRVTDAAAVKPTADLLLGQLQAAEHVYDITGSIWGQAGVSRQQWLREDYSFAGLELRAIHKKGGRPLTAAEKKEVADLAARYKAAVELREKEQTETTAAQHNADMDDAIKDVAKEAAAEQPKKRPEPTKQPSQKKTAEAEKVKAARDHLAKAKQRMKAVAMRSTSPGALGDPEIIAAAVDVVKAYVELGVANLSVVLANMRADPDVDMAYWEQPVKDAWADMESQGQAPSYSVDDADPDDISALAREILRDVVVARGIVNPTAQQREAALDDVTAEMQKLIPAITKTDVMWAITKYGRFKEPTKDEVEETITDLRGQMRQLIRLEEMAKGNAPKAAQARRHEPTDELRQLTQQMQAEKKAGDFEDEGRYLKSALATKKTVLRNRMADMLKALKQGSPIVQKRHAGATDDVLEQMKLDYAEVKAQYDAAFRNPNATQEQRIRAAELALDRAIEQLDRELKAGELGPKKLGAKLDSPAIQAKRATLEALQAHREELRAASPEYQADLAERERLRKKADLATRLAKWERKVATKDVVPQKRKPMDMDEQDQEHAYKIDLLKKEAKRILEKIEYENQTTAERALYWTGEAANMSKAWLTSADLSAFLRHGAVFVASHPVMAVKMMPAMMKAFYSQRAEFQSAEALRKHPNAMRRARAGLAITVTEGGLNKQEELFMGHWASKTGPLWKIATVVPKSSARAFTTFLNEARASWFDMMCDQLGSKTQEQDKVIANFVNAATGRGSFGKLESSAAALSTVFFAARYAMSNFQMLLGQPLWRGDKKTRMLIGKEYGRALAGLLSFYGLVMMAAELFMDDDDEDKPTISFDPTSSDFGKVKFGNTRLDPLRGLSQTLVFTTRMGRAIAGGVGQQIGIEPSKELAKEMQKTPTTVWRFIRSKFTPWLGNALNVATGENFNGETLTTEMLVQDTMMPFSVQDMVPTMEEQGVPRGTALQMAAILGMGVSTYEKEQGIPEVTREHVSSLHELWSKDTVSPEEAWKQAVLGEWYSDEYLPIRRRMLADGATDADKKAAAKELTAAAGNVESHRSTALRKLRDAVTQAPPRAADAPATYRRRLEKWRKERAEAQAALKFVNSGRGS